MREESNLTDLIDLIDPFADDVGQTYAHIPVFQEKGVVTPAERPVEATDFLAWLRMILHEMVSKIPKDKDLANALDVIRGYAMERPRRAAKNPVPSARPDLTRFGQALLLIAKDGPTRATLPVLAKRIESTSRRKGLLDPGISWPMSGDSLGQTLSQYVAIMQPWGVILERHDTARPREWSVYLADVQPPSKTPLKKGNAEEREVAHRDPVTSDAGVEKVTDASPV